MSDKIEDLLSPERLRGRWQRAEKKVGGSDGAEAEEHGALQIFAKLKRLIEKRFQGDNVLVLKLLLEGLETHLVQRFPETGDAPEDQEALDLAINEILNQLEDLVEAFELGGSGR